MQVMQPSQDGLLTTNDRNPLVASDRGQSVSPSAMIGKEQQSPLDVGVAVNSDSNDGQKSGDSGKPSGKDGQKQKKNVSYGFGLKLKYIFCFGPRDCFDLHLQIVVI